jgi:hypothetical protein
MEQFVSYQNHLYLIEIYFFLDAAEILETRVVDGTDQQEYFVHYLNCKFKLKFLITYKFKF